MRVKGWSMRCKNLECALSATQGRPALLALLKGPSASIQCNPSARVSPTSGAATLTSSVVAPKTRSQAMQ